MSDVYSHGLCWVCHEQHDEKYLTEDAKGNLLCQTCYLEYLEQNDG